MVKHLLCGLAVGLSIHVAVQGQTPAGALPRQLQAPFEPDAALLARLRSGQCWSEFRLWDPVHRVLGETVALEWFDKLDESVMQLHLRVEGRQQTYRRLDVRYRPPGAKVDRSATGDEGPDQVGTGWMATYRLPRGKQGVARMTVVEGTRDSDEHVSTGVLELPGVLSDPVTVAHSAGCNRD